MIRKRKLCNLLNEREPDWRAGVKPGGSGLWSRCAHVVFYPSHCVSWPLAGYRSSEKRGAKRRSGAQPPILWVCALCSTLLSAKTGSSQMSTTNAPNLDNSHNSALTGEAPPLDKVGDGRDSPCTAQHAFLLQKYRKRPPWLVAGVDYCVGHDPNTVLKDPATISDRGVTVNPSNHLVIVTGNDVALDGYDFSLDGGWQVRVKAANARIVHSKFVVGSNDLLPIVGSPEASHLDVSHCTIDGAEHDPPPWGTMVAYSGVGLTIEYSWLKNSGGDMIQHIGGTGSIVIEHNLIENGGLSPGTHGDYTQLEGGPFIVAINYNTTLQSRGTTQGLMTEYVAEGEIGHNTMIGTVSYFVSVDLSSIRTTFTVHDNYFDPRGYGFAYPSRNTGTPNDSSPKSIFTNNVNMRTGVVLQDAVRR